MTTYATPASIRAALLDLHERILDAPPSVAYVGGALLVRELTAGQRLRAGAAARVDNPDEPDVGLYNARLVQMAVVDPESGTPYADGRTDDSGQPLIDPRTRRPLFSADDLPLLAEARDVPLGAILDTVAELGALAPHHLQARHPAPHGGERDAGAGAAEPGDADGAPAAP
jgi:hypothetical protein